jgi:Arc/MetJ-type ribon-helix-helix transcriptional regulator
MGRLKIAEEKKARNISISLSIQHRKMLDEILKDGKFKKTSDLFQELIENKHLSIFKGKQK